MTPAQRLQFNLSQRGIIAQRHGKAWTLHQTDTATATRALFYPDSLQTAAYKTLTNTRNGYQFTTAEVKEYLK